LVINEPYSNSVKVLFMIRYLLAVVALLMVSSCTVVSHNTTNMTDITKVDFSKDFSSGQSCEYWFLGFGPMGSSSPMEAAKIGNISTVEYVEHDFSTYIVISSRCTTVFGEKNEFMSTSEDGVIFE
jgi:hypothetical protein